MTSRDVRPKPRRRETSPTTTGIWDIVEAVLRDIVPDSRRTLHLILLLSIPPLIFFAVPLTVVLLLIPNPSALLTTALCGVGTTAVAGVSAHRRAARRRALSAGRPRGAADGAQPGETAEASEASG